MPYHRSGYENHNAHTLVRKQRFVPRSYCSNPLLFWVWYIYKYTRTKESNGIKALKQRSPKERTLFARAIGCSVAVAKTTSAISVWQLKEVYLKRVPGSCMHTTRVKQSATRNKQHQQQAHNHDCKNNRT